MQQQEKGTLTLEGLPCKLVVVRLASFVNVFAVLPCVFFLCLRVGALVFDLRCASLAVRCAVPEALNRLNRSLNH